MQLDRRTGKLAGEGSIIGVGFPGVGEEGWSIGVSGAL